MHHEIGWVPPSWDTHIPLGYPFPSGIPILLWDTHSDLGYPTPSSITTPPLGYPPPLWDTHPLLVTSGGDTRPPPPVSHI